MCFLFEMKFLQGKNYIPFIIYIFTRTQTCIEQCLINIRSDFAGVTFLSINFNLIGLRFTISPQKLCIYTISQHIIISSILYGHSFILPSIQQSTSKLVFFSSALGKLSLQGKGNISSLVGHRVSVAGTLFYLR